MKLVDNSKNSEFDTAVTEICPVVQNSELEEQIPHEIQEEKKNPFHFLKRLGSSAGLIQNSDNSQSPTQNTLRIQSIILLVAIALIWGTTFPLIKDSLSSISPAALIATRFAVAAIIFLPRLRGLNASLLKDGGLLGLLLFASFAIQAIAVESICANRAAFIASLNAIIVPLLGSLLGQRVLLRTFLAAGVALIGIGVMSWESGRLGIGDYLLFGEAFIYAIYILILDKVAQRHPPLSLTAVQLLVIAILGAIWVAPKLVGQMGAIEMNWQAILYLGLVATAATTCLQAIAQRWTSAHQAAIFYTLEPVFSSVFSFWLLGERLKVRGLVGAVLVLGAMVLSISQGQDIDTSG
ncbi:MAG: DMT family transporter [Microcystaceae cyanobacterium]